MCSFDNVRVLQYAQFGPGRLVQHSPEPNLRLLVVADAAGKARLLLVARHDIEAGQRLTLKFAATCRVGAYVVSFQLPPSQLISTQHIATVALPPSSNSDHAHSDSASSASHNSRSNRYNGSGTTGHHDAASNNGSDRRTDRKRKAAGSAVYVSSALPHLSASAASALMRQLSRHTPFAYVPFSLSKFAHSASAATSTGDNGKGNGVRTNVTIPPNHYVLEYGGQHLDRQQSARKEEEYAAAAAAASESVSASRSTSATDESVMGCYMFFMKDGSSLDATIDDASYGLGRFINHSRLEPNLRAMQYNRVSCKSGAKRNAIIFVSIREIRANEELLFDYGDRINTQAHPWLNNS